MSSFAVELSNTSIGRIDNGGAIIKKKKIRQYIRDVFIALQKHSPENNDKIQCFIRLYYYFISVYATSIFRRSHPCWNFNTKNMTTGCNLVNTALAFSSCSATKILDIQAKCYIFLKGYIGKGNDKFFTPEIISEMLTFIDSSIHTIIYNISIPVLSINPEIKELMEKYNVPKTSTLLNHSALATFLQNYN
jgi:hypothetical protein